jgi:GTP-binding protein
MDSGFGASQRPGMTTELGSAVAYLKAQFTRAEIEAGRKLFAAEWHFAIAAAGIDSLPKPSRIEIAFAGRSNVGKSSLINALTGRRALARTSHTPGRTQELIFFDGPASLTMVDMPGYGYAAAAKHKAAAWGALIHAYLKGRANLARLYLLVDARHGFKPIDDDLISTLDKAAVNYQVVLTKSDAAQPVALAEIIRNTTATLSAHPAAYPDTSVTSARTGAGVPELRAAIARLVQERKRG